MFFTERFSWRMQRLLAGLSFAVLLLAASPAFADTKGESIRFAYGIVEGFIEEGGAGVGYELMNAVLARLQDQGHQVSVSRVPFKRLLTGFQNKQYELAFPIVKINNFTLEGYRKWGFEEIPLYSRPLYDGGEFVIYTKAETDPLSDLRNLSWRKTVVIEGAYIPIDLVPPTSYRVERVFSGEQAFKMLKFGRVDAFLVHEGWGKSILAELDMSGLHHGKPFGAIRGGFIAQDDEQGAALIRDVNAVIADIVRDGTYQAILNRFPDNKLVVRPEQEN